MNKNFLKSILKTIGYVAIAMAISVASVKAISIFTVQQGGTGVGTISGIIKGNGTSPFTAATADTDYSTPAGTETFTNKTFDTAGTGNVFKIAGTTISAKTGTGSAVLATSPTLVTPVLGVATGTSFNGVAITTGGSATTFLNGAGSYAAPFTLTTTGTSGAATFSAGTLNIPQYTGGGGSGLTVGTTTITSGTSGNLEYNNAGVLGEKAVTGSGSVVLGTSPSISGATLTTSSINGVTPTTGGGTTTFLNANGAYSTPAGSSYTAGTGLTLTTGAFSVNTSQNIATLSNLTSNGLVTTSGGAGTLGITSMGSGIATFLGTPTSANLAAAITDETGTGANVFANTPTLVTPILGAATATTINKVTITAPTTSSTLTIADGTSLNINHSLTVGGTNAGTLAFGGSGTTQTFPSASDTLAGLGTAQTFTAQQTFSSSSQLNVKNLETIQFSDRQTGADLGIQVNNAYSAGPSTGVKVIVPSGSWTLSTLINANTLNKPLMIECLPGAVITSTLASSAITFNLAGEAVGSGHGQVNFGVTGCTFVGPSYTGGSIAITLGGTQGAQNATIANNKFTNFTQAIVVGNNTWGENIANNYFENNGQALSMTASPTNSGEMVIINGNKFADCLNSSGVEVADNCVQFGNNSIASSSITNNQFDDAQLRVGTSNLDLSVTGNHFEDPNLKSYRFIIVDDATTSYTTVTLQGNEFLASATASLVDSYILNGGIINLYGNVATGNGVGTTLANFIDNDAGFGTVNAHGGVTNNESAFTNVADGYSYPSASDANTGIDFFSIKNGSTPFGFNKPPTGAAYFFNGGNKVATVTSGGLWNFGSSATSSAILSIAPGQTTIGQVHLDGSGSLLTSPTDGTLEYNGSHLYFTIGTTRAQLDGQSGSTYTAGSGLTLSGGAFSVNQTQSLTNISTALLAITGNQSSAAWGVNGLALSDLGGTYTDTSSTTGTVTNNMVNAIAQPTLAATNTGIVYTNAASLYIAGAPGAGSHVTITNPYSLYVAGGQAYFGGASFFGGHMNVEGVTSTGATGTGNFVFATSPTLTTPNIGVASASGLTVNASRSAAAWTTTGLQLSIGSNSLTDTSSTGTVANTAANAIGIPTLLASSATTYTNSSSLYIAGAPVASTNVTQTNPYALFINGGVSYFGGQIKSPVNSTTVPNLSFGDGTDTSSYLFTAAAGRAMAGYTTADANANEAFVLNGGGGKGIDLYVNGTNNSFKTGTLAMWMLSDASMNLSSTIKTYAGVATVGEGVPAIYGYGRFTGQTAAKASVATYTVGASDGTFVIGANVNVTTSTTHSFTVTCTYTDETNTSRTLTLNFQNIGGTISPTIANAGGAVPYEGLPVQIRAKASTAITIATVGTFTAVTYNVEGTIQQLD